MPQIGQPRFDFSRVNGIDGSHVQPVGNRGDMRGYLLDVSRIQVAGKLGPGEVHQLIGYGPRPMGGAWRDQAESIELAERAIRHSREPGALFAGIGCAVQRYRGTGEVRQSFQVATELHGQPGLAEPSPPMDLAAMVTPLDVPDPARDRTGSTLDGNAEETHLQVHPHKAHNGNSDQKYDPKGEGDPGYVGFHRGSELSDK